MKPTLIDIIPPKKSPLLKRTLRVTPLPLKRIRRLTFPKILTATFLSLVLIVLEVYALSFIDFARQARQSTTVIFSKLNEAKQALKGLDPGNAKNAFQSINEQVTSINNQADRLHLDTFASIIGLFSDQAKNLTGFLKRVGTISGAGFGLMEKLAELKTNGFEWIVNGEGEKVITALKDIDRSLTDISSLSAELKNQSAEFGYDANSWYLPATVSLYKNQGFLQELTIWLDNPKPQHLLVLFQNPSEIRPGGGFIGSYADLTITHGTLGTIDVRDIYDPDGQLDLKTIPPKELQKITVNWAARDSNWFFDFPESAKKTIQFLEASKIYQEKNVSFNAIVAVNVNVLKKILETVGPIALPDYQLTITSDNFLPTIQAEVEAGKDKSAGQPKRILKVLTPLLLKKISVLSDDQKQKLIADFQESFDAKNIMTYFKDPVLQSYVHEINLDGEVASLPNNFSGDYLAVVNANIGGDKSDAFIRQKIRLESRIDGLGLVTNNLTVERTHSGETAKEWWYRTTNHDFLKFFVPRNAALTGANGLKIKDIPTHDYENYSVDLQVQTIEATRTLHEKWSTAEYLEAGKTVFAGWLDTPAGTTKKATLQYQNLRKLTLGRSPVPYTFIYEKQSGVDTALEFSIEAPPGYQWKDNRENVYHYTTDNATGRLTLNLTLERLP